MGVSGHPELNGDVGFCVRTLEFISRRRDLFYENRHVEFVKNQWRRTIFDARIGLGVLFNIHFDINIVTIGHGSTEIAPSPFLRALVFSGGTAGDQMRRIMQTPLACLYVISRYPSIGISNYTGYIVVENRKCFLTSTSKTGWGGGRRIDAHDVNMMSF